MLAGADIQLLATPIGSEVVEASLPHHFRRSVVFK
jgi:hypothetical protein